MAEKLSEKLGAQIAAQQGGATTSLTSQQIINLVNNAPPLDAQQAMLAEMAQLAIENDDRDLANSWLDSMSNDGLGRLLRDLKQLSPLVQLKLMGR